MSVLPVFDPRRILAVPAFYSLFQRLLGYDKGASRLRDIFALKPGDRVLDIGCGTADILYYLPENVSYHGLDVSAHYIATARTRFGTRGTFAVEAIAPSLADQLNGFDLVIAVGVLHHLTDVDADTLFAVAKKVLQPGGRVVTCDGAIVRGQNPLARLMLRMDRGQYVRAPDDYLTIARRSFPGAKAQVVHDLTGIPYTHCIIEGVQATQ